MALMLVSLPSFSNNTISKLRIETNENVELLGLAYYIKYEADVETQSFVENGKTFLKKDWQKFGFYIYEKYKKFANSPNLESSFNAAGQLWLDYIINLLLQLDNFPNARLLPNLSKKYYIRFSEKNDESEARLNATKFLDGLNKFYKEVDFAKYLDETKQFYSSAIKEVRGNIPDENSIITMEKFYHRSFNSYHLVPSLTIPSGMGFGLRFTIENHTKIYNVFGAFDAQTLEQSDSINMGFANPDRLRELSIHEFGHSFVNPVVDSLPEQIIKQSEILFQPIRDSMSVQGYTTWKRCLYEHFVRAGEIVIAELLGNKDSSLRLREDYISNRHFKYLPIFISRLEEYSKSDKMYYQVVSSIMDDLLKIAK